ncbi:hypothetical protein T08_11587, partial [Trichinella sp. T8]
LASCSPFLQLEIQVQYEQSMKRHHVTPNECPFCCVRTAAPFAHAPAFVETMILPEAWPGAFLHHLHRLLACIWDSVTYI